MLAHLKKQECKDLVNVNWGASAAAGGESCARNSRCSFSASTFPSRLHLHPLPMNLLGLFWCETLATTCGYFSLLDWRGSKQNRKLKAFGFVVDCTAKRSRVSILSSNLIAPLHIWHWRTLGGYVLVLVQASEPEAQVVMLCARPEVAGPLHLCTCAHCACKLHIQFIVHIYAHNANLCSLCTFVLMMHTCAQWCILVLIVHFCAPIFSSYNAWTTCSCCYTWPRLYSITNILLKIMQFRHHVFHYPVCKRRLLDLGRGYRSS